MVMAVIFVKCGEYDRAIDELESLLSQNTNYTSNDFKLNRDLAPLWKLPRYLELLKKYPVLSSGT